MSDSRTGLRLATYNVEWFNALFDDNGRMLDDREPSTRYKITRAEQLAALAIVFTALDADGITIIEAPDNATISRVSVELGARGGIAGMTMAAIPLDEFIGRLERGTARRRGERKKR